MERTITHGPITVTVQMPDEMPADVADSLQVDVDLKAETEEAARGAIGALGGLAAFEGLRGSFGSLNGWLHLKGAGYGRPLTVMLTIPTGRDRPVPDAPFISELREEQAAAVAADAEERKLRVSMLGDDALKLAHDEAESGCGDVNDLPFIVEELKGRGIEIPAASA